MSSPRIYLDNAATSYPKPESVWRAVDRFQRELGTAVGRGSTRAGNEVQRVVDQCRLQVARFFGVRRPEQVIFTLNGTDSLNTAIQGLLREGDRVVTTVWDHNSVLRPLKKMEQSHGVQTEIIRSDGAGGLDLESLAGALKTPTRLVVLTHASNVTGIIQPVEEVVRLAHSAGALVLLDAAQSAGHLPVNMQELGVDLIACPGHKGLLGPLGTGLLLLAPEIEKQLVPFRFGGTGSHSESPDQPMGLPDRYEAGNLNAPGIFGLSAALEWLQSNEETVRGHQTVSALISGLTGLPGVECHLVDGTHNRVDVVSLTMGRTAPDVIAGLLDEHFAIETRAGLHCAPLAHGELGTLSHGGTIRLSPGPFTTMSEVDQVLEALAQIAVAL